MLYLSSSFCLISVRARARLLLEKPFVFADVVSLFKFLFDFRSCTGSFASVLQNIFVHNRFVQSNIYAVSSRHQVVVVNDFDERFDLGSFGNFLLSHWFCHLPWVFVDTSYKSMTVWTILSPIVVLFDNDGFSTGIFSSKYQNNFS